MIDVNSERFKEEFLACMEDDEFMFKVRELLFADLYVYNQDDSFYGDGENAVSIKSTKERRDSSFCGMGRKDKSLIMEG